MSVNGAKILKRLREEAAELGFHAVEVAPVPMELRKEYYQQWIADGKHGTMAWMERNNDRRLQPDRLIPDAEAKSIIVLAFNYYQPNPERNYRIAKYALGDDYHNFMLRRIKRLCRILRDDYGGQQRPYVDTGPLLEKSIAEAAGLGWQGKSTILIEPKRGTWSFLANIVTTLELPSGEKEKDRCGTCTRCIDVCPTRAITAPYQLDASKCISYLTIEHDGPIPEVFREAIGDRLYGCDECLDVCPWNKWAEPTVEAKFAPRELPELREMLLWDEVTFTEMMQGSPMRRLKLRRFKRNICIVLGNVGCVQDIEALKQMKGSTDPVLDEHADWAIRQIERRFRESYTG